MKGWFNNIYGNYKYNNKEIYYKVYNKPKEVFQVLIPLLIEEITICSDYTTRIPVLYTPINTRKKT